MFDLLGINLMHGWIVDPRDGTTVEAFGSRSYNEAVELMVASGLFDDAGGGGGGGVDSSDPSKLMRINSKGSPGGLSSKSRTTSLVPRSATDFAAVATDSDPAKEAISFSITVDEVQERIIVVLSISPSTPPPVVADSGEAAETAKLQEEQRIKAKSRAIVIRDFLDNHCTQLTAYGLEALSERMRENQLGLFFRNLHFSVIFKHQGRLFLLVTDQVGSY